MTKAIVTHKSTGDSFTVEINDNNQITAISEAMHHSEVEAGEMYQDLTDCDEPIEMDDYRIVRTGTRWDGDDDAPATNLFRTDNTEGYTPAQLAALNAEATTAVPALMQRYHIDRDQAEKAFVDEVAGR